MCRFSDAFEHNTLPHSWHENNFLGEHPAMVILCDDDTNFLICLLNEWKFVLDLFENWVFNSKNFKTFFLYFYREITRTLCNALFRLLIWNFELNSE